MASPTMVCHGYNWKIVLFPGGHETAPGDQTAVSVFLFVANEGEDEVKASFNIRVPSAHKALHSSEMRQFKENVMRGYRKFASRTDVLDRGKKYLVDGNLIIEADIQVLLDTPPAWSPTSTLSLDMLQLLDSANANNSDVAFQIKCNIEPIVAANMTRKGLHPRRTQVFYAHRAILSARCPLLAAVAEGSDVDTPIDIESVDPELFRMLLRFIYGEEVPAKDSLRQNPLDIIRTADRFDCNGLKLAAEAEFVADRAININTNNAAELIMFADATHCALLKEAACDYFAANSEDVRASSGFSQMMESSKILDELLALALDNNKRPAIVDTNGRDFKRMRVATLRQKLDARGLDVDGSKEMLISRLEASEKNEVIEIE